MPCPYDTYLGIGWDSATDQLVRDNGSYVYNFAKHNWYAAGVARSDYNTLNNRSQWALGANRVDDSVFKGLGTVSQPTKLWLNQELREVRVSRLRGMQDAERMGQEQISDSTVTTTNPNDVAQRPTQGACVINQNGKQIWANPCPVQSQVPQLRY